MIRSTKLRQSAKGESCTMESPNCNGNPETVVWCHSNFSMHGKGTGIKAHDVFGFYGCAGCHDWYDGRTNNRGAIALKRDLFFAAHSKSLVRLIEKGILKL